MSEKNNNMTTQYLRLKAIMKVEQNEPDVESLLRDFHASHDAPKTKRISSRYWWTAAVAASIALLVAIALFLKHNYSAADDMYIAYEKVNLPHNIVPEVTLTTESGKVLPLQHCMAKNGKLDFKSNALDEDYDEELVVLWVPYDESLDIILPDGSQAMLYPGAKLTFPSIFNGKERKVQLEGNAYFCVTRNEEQPFIVNANGMETKVLGTEFQICSSERESSNVTLVSGSVKVSLGSQSARLAPKQKISFSGSATSNISTVDVTSLTMWRDGYIYFDNMSMEAILQEIGKMYNCSVAISNHLTHQRHSKMRFIADKHSDLASIIRALDEISSAQISIADGMISAK